MNTQTLTAIYAGNTQIGYGMLIMVTAFIASIMTETCGKSFLGILTTLELPVSSPATMLYAKLTGTLDGAM